MFSTVEERGRINSTINGSEGRFNSERGLERVGGCSVVMNIFKPFCFGLPLNGPYLEPFQMRCLKKKSGA